MAVKKKEPDFLSGVSVKQKILAAIAVVVLLFLAFFSVQHPSTHSTGIASPYSEYFSIAGKGSITQPGNGSVIFAQRALVLNGTYDRMFYKNASTIPTTSNPFSDFSGVQIDSTNYSNIDDDSGTDLIRRANNTAYTLYGIGWDVGRYGYQSILNYTGWAKFGVTGESVTKYQNNSNTPSSANGGAWRIIVGNTSALPLSEDYVVTVEGKDQYGNTLLGTATLNTTQGNAQLTYTTAGSDKYFSNITDVRVNKTYGWVTNAINVSTITNTTNSSVNTSVVVYQTNNVSTAIQYAQIAPASGFFADGPRMLNLTAYVRTYDTTNVTGMNITVSGIIYNVTANGNSTVTESFTNVPDNGRRYTQYYYASLNYINVTANVSGVANGSTVGNVSVIAGMPNATTAQIQFSVASQGANSGNASLWVWNNTGSSWYLISSTTSYLTGGVNYTNFTDATNISGLPQNGILWFMMVGDRNSSLDFATMNMSIYYNRLGSGSNGGNLTLNISSTSVTDGGGNTTVNVSGLDGNGDYATESVILNNAAAWRTTSKNYSTIYYVEANATPVGTITVSSVGSSPTTYATLSGTQSFNSFMLTNTANNFQKGMDVLSNGAYMQICGTSNPAVYMTGAGIDNSVTVAYQTSTDNSTWFNGNSVGTLSNSGLVFAVNDTTHNYIRLQLNASGLDLNRSTIQAYASCTYTP